MCIKAWCYAKQKSRVLSSYSNSLILSFYQSHKIKHLRDVTSLYELNVSEYTEKSWSVTLIRRNEGSIVTYSHKKALTGHIVISLNVTSSYWYMVIMFTEDLTCLTSRHQWIQCKNFTGNPVTFMALNFSNLQLLKCDLLSSNLVSTLEFGI